MNRVELNDKSNSYFTYDIINWEDVVIIEDAVEDHETDDHWVKPCEGVEGWEIARTKIVQTSTEDDQTPEWVAQDLDHQHSKNFSLKGSILSPISKWS